jgi:hypothetical protein
VGTGTIDLIFLTLAFAFVVVASLATLATTSASPMVIVMANKMVDRSAGRLWRHIPRGSS